jgi:hypothetical protein
LETENRANASPRTKTNGKQRKVERAMGIEPTLAFLPSLQNKRFDAMADAKCDSRVNFRGMWGNVGLRTDTWVGEISVNLAALFQVI